MKHRVLQSEVVVKTSQVVAEVLRHQHVWNEGEAGLHGQDVRSQRKRDVAQEVRQHGGGGGFHRCRGSCRWNCSGERWRVLWLSWVAAGGLWGKAGGLLKVISWLQTNIICPFHVFNCRFFLQIWPNCHKANGDAKVTIADINRPQSSAFFRTWSDDYRET